MTAIKRKTLILIAAFIALASLALGAAFGTRTVKADSAVTFENGAYIRIDTENAEAESTTGIRFAATVAPTLYDANEVGMIIIPSSILAKFDGQSEGGISDLFEFCSKKYGKAKADISQPTTRERLEANNGKMTGAIVNIKGVNFRNEYTAIAYSHDGANYTYYKSGVNRTITAVANKAFEASSQAQEGDEQKLNAAQKEKLTEIIKKSVKVSLGDNESGNEIAKTVAKGKTIDLGKTFTDESISGETVWSIKTGSDVVKISGNEMQTLKQGNAVLTVGAYNGELSFDVTINVINDTTGNIAPTAATDKIVSSFSTTGNNKVYNQEGKLYYSVNKNLRNHMIFDSKYVQDCYNSGLTTIALKFYLGEDFVNETWANVYFGYLDSSDKMNYFMDGSEKLGEIPIKTANVGESNSKTVYFTLTERMFNQIDFASGARFVLGDLQAGINNNKLEMIITNLEFKTTMGNIAPTAATDKIVSSFSTTGNNKVYNQEGKLYYSVNKNLRNHMIFDSKYVQDCYNSGLTTIALKFYLGEDFVNETWANVYFGYLDSSDKMNYFMDGSEKLGEIPIKTANVGESNSKTVYFTLTERMFNQIDFANGARFVLGDLQAGSNDPLKMIITHLEFSKP